MLVHLSWTLSLEGPSLRLPILQYRGRTRLYYDAVADTAVLLVRPGWTPAHQEDSSFIPSVLYTLVRMPATAAVCAKGHPLLSTPTEPPPKITRQLCRHSFHWAIHPSICVLHPLHASTAPPTEAIG